MGYVAPIIAGVGQVVEGVAANEAAGASADMTRYNTRQQAQATKSEYQRARATQVAGAGASGLEITSGSFMDIFEENAVNQARTLADIKYAGKVQAAQQEQAGKNALIGGIVGGVAKAATGLSAQKQYNAEQAWKRSMLDGGSSEIEPGGALDIARKNREIRRLGLLGPR